MEGLDRDKINKIILEASKGSKFYENELKKERQVNQRIEKMMQQKAKITEQQLQKAQAEVYKLSAELEMRRDLSRVIVHVDMDAFYAAVEMRDCPELRDKPMAVGSMSMLSTSNYHARRFGVRAAMPGFIAKRLCPNLVIVPTNFDKYRAVSSQVREIFSDYDPHFLPMSLDEAYLDITDHLEQREHWPASRRTYRVCSSQTVEEREGQMLEAEEETDNLSPVLFEDSPTVSPTLPEPAGDVIVFGTCAEEAVREMRFRIEQKTTLTASAGIAPNMMLAKVCSDKNKPNGQYRIPSEHQAVMDFTKDLPVRKVSGIGKVTEKMLGSLDITTCAQLGQKMALLSLLFSETSWHHFLQISLGLGSTHRERDSERKSMSTERTFSEMSDLEEQYALCRELCEDLAQDLQREGLKGKTVTLKLKNVDFEVRTRAFTLQCPVCTTEEIFAAAKDLLKAEVDHVSPQPLKLRLMGVRVSSFINVEEKKPLQKSIVGFLQAGGSDPNHSQRSAPVFRTVADKSSESPRKELSSETGEQEDKPKHQNRWVIDSGGFRAPQQQSFFQRVQSRRLAEESELKAREENAQTSNRPTDTKPVTNADASGPDKAADTKSSTNQESSPAASMPQSLTCPVCFRQMGTIDLTALNRHIDKCLSESVTGCEKTSIDTGQERWSDVCEEKKDQEEENTTSSDSCHSKATPSTSEGDRALVQDLPSKDDGEKPSTSVLNSVSFSTEFGRGGLTPSRPNHDRNSNDCDSHASDHLSHESKPTSVAPLKMNSSNSGGVFSQHSKGTALTCPVCCKPQETDDLSLFNRHVDVCLNQRVLQELRETDSPANGNTEDPQHILKSRGKSKRKGSSPPPSKKPRAVGTRHTIDKFFRGGSR
ncbi:DNA polymerase kappa [Chanos chanos]|uniref:DNA polymerase kappa n=1 Tax=Chanos chanos TaxID=29144 RepID=A0A6J2WTW1_CHACN|nr:DNA polymerase kappa [Chanos chanos]